MNDELNPERLQHVEARPLFTEETLEKWVLGFDVDFLAAMGMGDSQALREQEHGCACVEEFAVVVAFFYASIAVITDDGESCVQQVATNLVEPSCVGSGLNE